jgi:hypothetical protein
MSPIGGLRIATDFIAPTFFSALLAVTAPVGIGIGKFIPSGNAPNEPSTPSAHRA